MKKRPARQLRLAHVPPLTRTQIASLARRMAAARARTGLSPTDENIPENVPPRSEVVHGPARRGRPRQTAEGTQPVTLRLPRRVVSYFKRGGPGWQTRAIAALTKAAHLDSKR
jgi:uncharacterized protein (DUF4415 family)